LLRRILAGTLLIVIAGGLALSWLFGSEMVRPHPSAVGDLGPGVRDISLRASDGTRIAGSYWSARRDAPALLLLHGLGASRQQFRDQARWLNGLGYAVLAIDFRGHGASEQRMRSFGIEEARDAAAAFAWLKGADPKRRIGVIGISLGGAAALLGADGPLPADALVLQAVFPDIRHAIRNRVASLGGALVGWIGEPFLSLQALPRFGRPPSAIAPVEAVRGYRGQLLVIGGADDRFTPPEETRGLFAAAPAIKSLWIVPGMDHAMVSGLDGPEYRGRVGAFLGAALGRPNS
jgi:pimeloyl-ACP methyl ester carboxylesterase